MGFETQAIRRSEIALLTARAQKLLSTQCSKSSPFLAAPNGRRVHASQPKSQDINFYIRRKIVFFLLILNDTRLYFTDFLASSHLPPASALFIDISYVAVILQCDLSFLWVNPDKMTQCKYEAGAGLPWQAGIACAGAGIPIMTIR